MLEIGTIVKSNNGSVATVIDYLNNKKVTIKYPSGITCVVQESNIRRGAFKDPFLPSVAGVGILGNSPLKFSEQGCVIWRNMLRRVYNPKEGGEKEAYKDCKVTSEWLLLPNFIDWFDKQIYEKGFHLDKDLLVKDNRVYSPETCIFLPQELNKFLLDRRHHRGKWPLGVSFKTSNGKWDAKISIESRTEHLGLFDSPVSAFNSYKKAKEAGARRLANKWKDRVDKKVVDSLMTFTVDITD